MFRSLSEANIWANRFRRLIYSTSMLANVHKHNKYDILLFMEPLYPQNLMLLRYLRQWTKAEIVIYVTRPRINWRTYYLPIASKFPALISGEIARPFAESIATMVEMVPPGIDTANLRPLDVEKKWELLYIGHLYREKGVFLLLNAMKWLKVHGSPLKLKVIHTPGLEARFYRNYIRNNGLDNVDMEEAMIVDKISVYNSARVFVYPGVSYNRVATVPITVLEASACGLPVVCTSLYRCIGLPNITFSLPDARSLAEAILQATCGSHQETCNKALDIIRNQYSIEVTGGMVESFLAGVIDGRKGMASL
jgi:glycosyltransferase involved in cell wall biosynthesis